jgi:hypothetical protein
VGRLGLGRDDGGRDQRGRHEDDFGHLFSPYDSGQESSAL